MPNTDTVTAKLTPGEFVIKKSAVDILGVPLLRKLNNLPDEGGHANMDKLISMATLANAKPMMGGGVTTPNYEGGDMVGYAGGGYMKPKKYQDGGMMAPDATSADIMNMLYQQSLPQAFDYGSLQDQDRIDRRNQEIMDMVTGSAGAVGRVAKPGKKAIEKFLKKYFNLPFTPKFNKTLPKIDFKGSPSQRDMAKFEYGRRKNIESQLDLYEDIPNVSQYKIQNAFELEDAGDMIDVLRKRGLFASGGLIGYQNGGAVQDDAMMQQFLQQQQMMQQPQQGGNGFVPFDQRQPGAAASGSWGEPGAYMESLRASRDSLQQAAEQARLDSARQSLEAIKLDSLIQSLGREGELIEQRPEPFGIYEQPQSPSEDSETRNRDEYMKQQMMQRFFEQNR